MTDDGQNRQVSPVPPVYRERAYLRAEFLFAASRERTVAEGRWADPFEVSQDLMWQRNYRPIRPPSWTARAESRTGAEPAGRVPLVGSADTLLLSDGITFQVTRQIERPDTSKLIQDDHTIVGAARFSQGKRILDTLNPFCSSAVRLDYRLDNGVPHPNEESLDEHSSCL